jgi:hypothetical protein
MGTQMVQEIVRKTVTYETCQRGSLETLKGESFYIRIYLDSEKSKNVYFDGRFVYML